MGFKKGTKTIIAANKFNNIAKIKLIYSSLWLLGGGVEEQDIERCGYALPLTSKFFIERMQSQQSKTSEKGAV